MSGGEENLMNDTPPKKRFWTPIVLACFPPPFRVAALFCLVKSGRLIRPDALFEGSRNFWEGALFGTFSSPLTFCTPPVMAQEVFPAETRGSFARMSRPKTSVRAVKSWNNLISILARTSMTTRRRGRPRH